MSRASPRPGFSKSAAATVLTALAVAAVLLSGWLLLRACGIEVFGRRLAWCGPAPGGGGGRIAVLVDELRGLERQARTATSCPPVALAPEPMPVEEAPPAEPTPAVDEPTPPDAPAVGDSLDLTPDFDLSSLEGCWQSDTSKLWITTPAGQEITRQTITFCFDPGGTSGRRITDREDGHRCDDAPLATRFQDGILHFDYPGVTCGGGLGGMAPGRVVCRAATDGSSSAICDLVDIIDGADEPETTRILGERFRKVNDR